MTTCDNGGPCNFRHNKCNDLGGGSKRHQIFLTGGFMKHSFIAAAFMIVIHFDSVSAATITDITYGGTGCPAGGAGISARLNPQTGRLVVYTPDMNADLDAARIVRLACDIAMPIKMEAGERLVIGRTSVFGKEKLAEGHKLTATAEGFVAGAVGPKVQLAIDGSGDKKLRDFYARSDDTLETACGMDVILRARNTLLALKPSNSVAGGSHARVKGLALDVHVEPCN